MSMTEETKTKLESSAGDLSDVENGNCSSSGSGGDTKKTCVDCGTSRTPLWRGGPAGPKVSSRFDLFPETLKINALFDVSRFVDLLKRVVK